MPNSVVAKAPATGLSPSAAVVAEVSGPVPPMVAPGGDDDRHGDECGEHGAGDRVDALEVVLLGLDALVDDGPRLVELDVRA